MLNLPSHYKTAERRKFGVGLYSKNIVDTGLISTIRLPEAVNLIEAG